MIPVAAALVGGAVLLAGVLDRRILAAAITATVTSNVASAIAVHHGVPDFLPPLALVAVVLAARDRLATSAPPIVVDRVSPAWVGAGLVAGVLFSAALGPYVSEHPVESTEQLILLAKSLLVVLALVLLVRDRSTLRAALTGVVLGGTAIAAITVVQWLFGWQHLSFGGLGGWSAQVIAGAGDVTRATGPFGDDPNSYAQHLAVAIGVSVGFAVTVQSRLLRRWMLWPAAAVMIAAMLATSSRTGLLALSAILAVALLLRPPTRRQLAAIVVAIVAIVLGPFGVGTRLGTLAQIGSIGGDVDTSLAGRASEALVALRLFGERPLTGVGYGAFPSEYLDAARPIGLESRLEPRSAHSLPLEIAAEQGLIGVTVWTAIAMFAVWVAWQLRRRHAVESAAYTLALAGFAVTALFLHDVYPRVMWMLVALAVGGARVLQRVPSSAVASAPRGPVVAMVIQNYVPALGGAERQLANLAPLLRERGIRPVVVTREMRGRPTRDEVDGVPVVRVPSTGPKLIRSARFVIGARRELDALRPDVVHAFDTLTPSLIALGHRRRHGTPVVVKLLRSGRIGDLAVLGRKPLGRRRVGRLIGDVDRFVAISSELVDELRRLGVDDERIDHIPNGVDTERFRPAAPPDGEHPAAGGPRVIATGRLAPEKRLDEIAKRWSHVRRRHRTAEFVVVGEGSEVAALDGHPGTRLLGRRDDVPELLRSADVYVSASSAEGLSNSLLEAMASGLPCVVTDVGGARDVIVHGVHGIVVDADDIDALIDEVTALLDDADRRHALGSAARARIATGWCLEATAEALSTTYRELTVPAASSSSVRTSAEPRVGVDASWAAPTPTPSRWSTPAHARSAESAP